MSYSADKLIKMSINYEQLANKSLLIKNSSAPTFAQLIGNYERTSDALQDFIDGLRLSTEKFARENLDDPGTEKILSLMKLQEDIISKVLPELSVLDDKIYE